MLHNYFLISLFTFSFLHGMATAVKNTLWLERFVEQDSRETDRNPQQACAPKRDTPQGVQEARAPKRATPQGEAEAPAELDGHNPV